MQRNQFQVPIIIAASLIAAQPAFAAEKVQHSQVVGYADLDLSSPAGIAALDGRIAGAIRKVCGRPYPDSLRARSDFHRCRVDTLAAVQTQRSAALASTRAQLIRISAR